MRFPAHKRKMLLMVLGLFGTVSVIFITWAMVRASTWIFYHDADATLNLEGFGTVATLAYAFIWADQGGGILIDEVVVGVVFLWLLWHTLYRLDKKHDTPNDA